MSLLDTRHTVRVGAGLRRLRDGTGPVTLVVLPHAGGNPGHYRRLVEAMPAQVTVLGVCYPGRLDRLAEATYSSVVDLATEVAADVNAVLSALPPSGVGRSGPARGPAGPVAFFGHSMGSYVAAEAAERLEQLGSPVDLLVASGSRAPHRTRARHVTMGGDDAIIEDATRLDPSSAAALDDLELRELVMPALRSDYAAVERYRRSAAPRLCCPVISYAGADDSIAPADEVARWAECATRSQHRTFPGGHFFTQTCPEVADDLGRRLLLLA